MKLPQEKNAEFRMHFRRHMRDKNYWSRTQARKLVRRRLKKQLRGARMARHIPPPPLGKLRRE